MNTSNSDEKVVLPKLVEWLFLDDTNCDRFAIVLGTIMVALIVTSIARLVML
jgi:hypothetical protein